MRILIADDHHLIVEGVKAKLRELGDAVEFATAMTVDDAFVQLDETPAPDLLVMDLAMPGAHGMDHVAQVRQRWPALPLVVLSGSEDGAQMKTLLGMGVRGYIPKAYSPEIMLSAVQLVLSGGVYVPPMLLEPSVAASTPAAPAHGPDHSLESLRSLLTARQVDVLRLLALGKPNKRIARELDISEGTVKIHLAAIFRALDVRNRVEAVVAAQRLSGL